MTRKEAIEKLKSLLFNEDKMAANQAKLADGTLISWEGDMAAGAAVMTIDMDGNQKPIEDNTYYLEDGTEITCVGGLITAIEKKEEEPAMEEMNSEFEAIFTKHIEQFGSVVSRIEKLENTFAELQSSLTNTNTDTESKFSKIVELVEAISNEPKVIEPKPANKLFTKNKPEKSAVDLFLEFQKTLKK